jgi:hypothetical protein
MPASDAASSHHTSPRSRPLTVAQSGPTGSELQKSASARKTFSGSQDEGSKSFAPPHVTALKPPSTTTITPVTPLLL